MFFLRRLFLFRFEVPIQIAGFDPIEQAVPSTTVPIAGYMVAADPLRVGQQETRERFTINAVLPDFFALKIMRSRDTMNRTFKRRMGQLLRSEEHTSELQSLMRISYAVFCLKKKKKTNIH